MTFQGTTVKYMKSYFACFCIFRGFCLFGIFMHISILSRILYMILIFLFILLYKYAFFHGNTIQEITFDKKKMRSLIENFQIENELLTNMQIIHSSWRLKYSIWIYFFLLWNKKIKNNYKKINGWFLLFKKMFMIFLSKQFLSA